MPARPFNHVANGETAFSGIGKNTVPARFILHKQIHSRVAGMVIPDERA
jgi:hypothetical protein